jgi:hypothetical protein
MNDSEFDNFLKDARAEKPLPVSFGHEVWQRIETADITLHPHFAGLQSIITALVRPWGAVAAIATMITLGLWLGAATAPRAEHLQMTYAESISPFAQSK